MRKQDLHKYQSDTWFRLVPIAPDTEVQGRIHVEINQYEYIPDFDDSEPSDTPKLSIR